jgi:hypothetical protein
MLGVLCDGLGRWLVSVLRRPDLHDAAHAIERVAPGRIRHHGAVGHRTADRLDTNVGDGQIAHSVTRSDKIQVPAGSTFMTKSGDDLAAAMELPWTDACPKSTAIARPAAVTVRTFLFDEDHSAVEVTSFLDPSDSVPSSVN